MDMRLLVETLDTLADPVIVIDREGVVQAVNRPAAAALSSPPESVLGTSILDWCSDGAQASLVELLAHLTLESPSTLLPNPLFPVSDHEGDRPLTVTAIDENRLRVLSVRLPDSLAPLPSGERHRDPRDPVDQRDPITGLLSRRMLPIVIERELTRAARSGSPPIALLFVMLHGFKQINQMHGHQIGDLLLENTGVRVRESVRKSDFVFRWEGTNLVVLLPELATQLDGIVVAEKIHSAVTVPYRFHGLDLAPDCHIGIALFPEDAEDADSLFNAANSAVIEAERTGEAVRHYDQDTHRKASDRLLLKTGLQRAFERNELELYFQPIVHPDGRIAGAEALMRWNHPSLGILGPAAFIELAEDSRLITPIDKLAIYTACRILVEFSDHPDFFISLNVSAINLSDTTLPTVVEQAIQGAGLSDPSRLKIELTESRTADNTPNFLTVIKAILEMGVEVWIDDFGTGQSSLSYLKHLPISTVKIDKDFVTELGENSDDAEYLDGIVRTVRSRNKRIVVEGISNPRQLDLVAKLPIDLLQGFYFARPMPQAQLREILTRTAVLPLDDALSDT